MDNRTKQGDLSPIHILEIIGNAIVGGMENYVYNLIQRLPSYGFTVTCLAPYESAYTVNLRRSGCDVFITSMDINPPWRSIQFSSELILHSRIDLIHAHLPRAHVLAGIASKLTNTPAAVTVHGMDITAEELGISRTTGTQMIVVCQQAYAQALALGMPPERLSLIPNGVDIKAFRPSKSESSFREDNGIPIDVPLAGFVGRLAYEKGPDNFIRLAHFIHRRHPHVHFVLVGDGPMLGEIQEMVKGEGLSDVVHLTGLASRMADVYQALDVLVQTSRVEGMPFVVLEAMACGLPVAAMSVGGVGEIVEVGTSGLTSAPGDWIGLGDGVMNLLDNPIKKKQMGSAARKRVEEFYDLSTSVHELASLFRRMVGRSPSKPEILQPNWPLTSQNPNVLPVKSPPTTPKKDE